MLPVYLASSRVQQFSPSPLVSISFHKALNTTSANRCGSYLRSINLLTSGYRARGITKGTHFGRPRSLYVWTAATNAGAWRGQVSVYRRFCFDASWASFMHANVVQECPNSCLPVIKPNDENKSAQHVSQHVSQHVPLQRHWTSMPSSRAIFPARPSTVVSRRIGWSL